MKYYRRKERNRDEKEITDMSVDLYAVSVCLRRTGKGTLAKLENASKSEETGKAP